ncbi:MAG: selenium metabolism-associated LysR family transcriptional regulator [Desulfuromonadaceae bacterium]|nr:selenium metabolism-associated LysR family transcriptional regulator [Desulfuromonadaceae bacterium]MDD5106153.1 selenium metabolism-associated LysR family transcriptional regulator [Desulfuromonadaceae bacterium]
MNIKQLEIFVAIATSGSFSKGAEAACITQSTVSQHIATLEDLCGVRLFDRTKRGAIPTEAGKIMLVHAQQVLKTMKETEQAILKFRQADGVELCVGGSTIPGTYLLPKAIAALRVYTNGIIVRVEIGDSGEILEKLVEEQIEIGIVGSTVVNKLITAKVLGHDEILLVARKGHRWCGRNNIAPEDLLREPIILRGQSSGTNDVVDTALRQHGIKTSNLMVCSTLSSSEAIKQAVLADCGVAFISEMAVRQELKHRELVAIKLSGLTITRSFSIVHRKGRTLSPAATAFLRILEQVTS